MQLSFKKFGNGPFLVILHGLYGNSDNWASIGKALSKKYAVFIPDLRNHGKSPHSKEHTYQLLAQDLLDFFNSQGIDKAEIIGHSMGGKLAMLFSLLNPNRVNNLVVVDIAPKKYTSLHSIQSLVIEHLNIMNAYLSVDLNEKTRRDEVDKEFAYYVKDTKVRNFLMKNLIREGHTFKWTINVKALSNNLPEIMDGPDFTKIEFNESSITFPVLFIKGEKSDYLKSTDLELIKTFFLNIEMVSISDAGHWIHAEQPEQFLKTISHFLK